MITTLALTLATPAVPAHAEWNHPLPRAWYTSLAQCETAGNTSHATRNYVTAFGIYRRTWDLYADTPSRRAHLLDFATQARVVDRIAFFGHTENGKKKWPVGPWGWSCLSARPRLIAELCRSTNPHVRRWRRHCTPGGN